MKAGYVIQTHDERTGWVYFDETSDEQVAFAIWRGFQTQRWPTKSRILRNGVPIDTYREWLKKIGC